MRGPNWFFAFPVQGSFVSQLPPPPAGIRRFAATDIHLTIAFLGRCDAEAAQRALVALELHLLQNPLAPLQIRLGPVVPMGPSRAYSALSALIDEGRERVLHAIEVVRDPLTMAAVRRKLQRAPKPHVTIARPRSNTSPVQRAAGLTWAHSLELSHVVSTLDRIALYTWSDERRQRLFQIVAERPLQPNPDSGFA